jgi:hypothetical protein
MSTDRELVEAAAAAMGLTGAYDDFMGDFVCDDDEFFPSRFSPLKDDGDALRLAVQRRICMNPADGGFRAWSLMPGHHEAYRDHDGDEMAAARRAIVRAAIAQHTGSDA